VWHWAAVAILEDELDAIVPSKEFDYYRRLLRAMRDGIDCGNEPVVARWTKEVCLDRAPFDQWLAQRVRAQRTAFRKTSGPKPHHDKMREALLALFREGKEFQTRQTAHQAVLERCKAMNKEGEARRGYSHGTFWKACSDLLPGL
jgi:hypothetical protein